MQQWERQAVIDQEQLRLLPIFYWVSGGFWAFYGLFMSVYFIFFGAMFAVVPFEEAGAPPQGFGWLFIGMGLFALVFMAAATALKILAGFWIVKRKNRVATMVAAALSCLEFPYGTLAGVLTLIVLSRPSVVALYETSSSADAAVEAEARATDLTR